MTVVAYVSSNHTGPVNLDGLVVTPAPSGTGRPSGASRMPAVNGVGVPRTRF